MEIIPNQISVEVDFEIPFEFKEINHSDFPSYEVENKVIIEPDPQNGFIYDSLKNVFDFDVSNTLVINAAVGQGKSFAVNKFAKEYYEKQEDYKIFIVVPFKSLITQYYKKLVELEIPEYEILDYQRLNDCNDKNSRTFHLITVNSLLGNFGDNSVAQGKIKREYLKNIITYCKVKNIKAVFFFDEIHDSIKNFKEIFIFNLLKWKGITHKVVVSSATYNETSKVVIKYLSELTNHKIRIIESRRIINEDKVSNLNLLFIQQVQQFNASNRQFLNLIENECIKARKINILTYTKSLAEKLTDKKSQAYQLLTKHNQTPNLCTSDSKSSFNPDLCNIGTNFKTGISIESENSTYIIIMPPIDYKKASIFSDGINSLIQALARPRNKSEIYIVLPFPDGLIEPIDGNKNYLSEISKIRGEFYSDFKYKYHNINNQDVLLKSFYKEIKSNFKEERKALKEVDRATKPRLKFPPLDIYSLEYAEKYFCYEHEIFGKNLSAYILWAGFNNQFFNCRLKSCLGIEFTNLVDGKIQVGLDKFYKDNFNYDTPFFELNSDIYCYNILKKNLFSSKVTFIDRDGKKKPITEGTPNRYHRHILSFLQRNKSAINWEFRKKIYPNGLINNKGNINDPVDYEFQVEDYLRASISVSLNDDYIIENPLDRELVALYKILGGIKQIFIDKYLYTDDNGKRFFLSDGSFKTYNLIGNDDYSEYCRIITTIKEKDGNIKLFSFFQDFKSTETEKSKKAIYSFMRKLFFETVVERINSKQFSNEKKANVLKSEIELGDGFSSLNLIYEPEVPWTYQSGNGDGYSEVVFGTGHPLLKSMGKTDEGIFEF